MKKTKYKIGQRVYTIHYGDETSLQSHKIEKLVIEKTGVSYIFEGDYADMGTDGNDIYPTLAEAKKHLLKRAEKEYKTEVEKIEKLKGVSTNE